MLSSFTLVRVSVAISAVVLLVTACTGPPIQEQGPSPEPTPSVLMNPIAADDDAGFYGLAANDLAQDQYGDYAALRVIDSTLIANLDSAEIDDAVTEHFDTQAIKFAAKYLTEFLVEWYIDTPLAFDDSQDVRDKYWADTASRWADAEFMRGVFDERTAPEPWALLDDDRGQWRQNGQPSYRPVPHVDGRARTKIQKIQLVDVEYDEIEWHGEMQMLMKFDFDVVYDRDVVLASGETLTEHSSGTVGFSFGRLEGLRGPITGVNWGMTTSVGHYIEGGMWGLPATSSTPGPLGSTFAVGDDLLVPQLEGFATVSDLDRAQERGIKVTSAEAPDVAVAYYEGPEFDANAAVASGGGEPRLVNEYVFTAFDPTPKPDTLSPSDQLREAAGEYAEEEYFLPLAATAMRLKGPGIANGYIDLRPATFDKTYDIVTVYVVSDAGPDYFARYFVAKGKGVETYDALLHGWRFKPAVPGGSELGAADPVG